MSELAKVACYSSSMPDGEAFSSCGVMGVVRMLLDFESWLGVWEELSRRTQKGRALQVQTQLRTHVGGN